MTDSEYDGEKVVTMMDVLQEQEAFEEDANAVLGASDDKNCTYSKGYVKRQAIYACLTCCPEAKSDASKRAGVCLACSLNCHENHDLIELYTKRLFRCDCGNPKLNGHPCTFTPNKTELNWDNKYNQNFSGLYCTCHRPYPDPEVEVEQEMIQCIICEDWLHADHLEATVPGSEQYAEMICKDCMEDNDFLHDYTDLVVNVTDKEVEVYDPDLDVSDLEALKKDKLTNGMVVDEKIESAVETNTSNTEQNAPHEDTSDKVANQENKSETDDISSTALSETQEDSKTEEKPTEEANTTSTSEPKENLESIDNKKDKQEPTSEDVAVEKEPESKEDSSNAEAQEKMEEDKLLQDESEKPEEAKLAEAESTIEEKSETEPKETQLNDTETTSNETKSQLNDTETTSNETKSQLNDTETTSNETKSQLNDTETASNETKSAETEPINASVDSTMENVDNSITDEQKSTEIESNSNESKRKLSTDNVDNISAKKKKVENENKCVRPRGVKRSYKGSTFWPGNFRQKLCTCGECLDMYKDLAVLYLIDLEDTVTAYEALGQERVDGPASQYEKGLQALSSLDRVQQINALTEYNNMRDKLLDFLKSFKDRKEVVKEEDIKEFFAGMKPKREPDGVYFCR